MVRARAMMDGLSATPNRLRDHGLTVNLDGVARTAWDLFAYPEGSPERLGEIWPEVAGIAPDILERLAIEGRYRGYVGRQDIEIARYRREEALVLPADLDYGAMASLSAEIRQKLTLVRPDSLAAAARIPGMTPAALAALLGHVRRVGAA
jgi:tRNA uridine 5-carboxymethylaminomethyl modification enzyme